MYTCQGGVLIYPGRDPITCLIDVNKRDDLTLGDNSIDVFKIGDSLDFIMIMPCISNLFVKL